MEIKRIVTGEFQTNSYIVIKNNSALLIDPSGNGNNILKELKNLKVSAILLTHGHFDHIKCVDMLKEKYACPIFLKKEDEELVRNKSLNSLMGHSASIKSKVEYLNEGKLTIDDFEIEVFHTPGHTQGSCIFLIENYLFTGDTLFKGSVGRCDLYGGNERQLYDSLKIFRSFKEDYYILPGHDDISTLNQEITYNPYL